MEEFACLRWPIISEEAIGRVSELLRRGNTSFDEELSCAFEATLSEFFKVRHALLTCNGTSALFSGFEAAGLQPGDEIIAPPLTHWASVLPATRLGCRVSFADLEPDSLSVSCAAIRNKITSRTRAVVVSHMYGNPVNVASIRALCDEYGLILIEDVSHAPGATLHGQPLGSFGHLAAVSMQGSKLISAGEGGVLLTNDDNFYLRAVELGHPKRSLQLGGQHRKVPVSRGFKFRLSPLMVVLGQDSFGRLNDILAARAAMAAALRERLANSEWIAFPMELAGAHRVYWEYEMFLQSPRWHPDDAVRACRSAGLPAAPMKYEFIPDLLPSHAHPDETWPHAERHLKSLLVIPAFNKLNEALIDRYAAALVPTA